MVAEFRLLGTGRPFDPCREEYGCPDAVGLVSYELADTVIDLPDYWRAVVWWLLSRFGVGGFLALWHPLGGIYDWFGLSWSADTSYMLEFCMVVPLVALVIYGAREYLKHIGQELLMVLGMLPFTSDDFM